jgi:hypothetical protein
VPAFHRFTATFNATVKDRAHGWAVGAVSSCSVGVLVGVLLLNKLEETEKLSMVFRAIACSMIAQLAHHMQKHILAITVDSRGMSLKDWVFMSETTFCFVFQMSVLHSI